MGYTTRLADGIRQLGDNDDYKLIRAVDVDLVTDLIELGDGGLAHEDVFLIDDSHAGTQSSTKYIKASTLLTYINDNVVAGDNGAVVTGNAANGILTYESESVINNAGAATLDGSTLTIKQGDDNSAGPNLFLDNKNGSSFGGKITFKKNSASPLNNDSLGQLSWFGNTTGSSGANTSFAMVEAISTDVGPARESGEVKIKVTTNNTGLQNGVNIAGSNSSNIVDIDLGYGTTSTTTVAGNLVVSGNEILDSGENTCITFDGSSNVTFSGNVGINTGVGVFLGNLTGDVTGNADTATSATSANVTSTISVGDAAESIGTFYPTLVDGLTGNKALETESSFTFEPSTGLLQATTFQGNVVGNVAGALLGDVTGDLTGNADTATTAATATSADKASKVILSNETSDTSCFVTFSKDATSAQDIHTNAGITFNSTTGKLSVTGFDCGSSGGSFSDLLTITNVENNDAGPILNLTKTRGQLGGFDLAGQDDDEVGEIRFNSKNSAAEDFVYGQIRSTISDASDSDELGKLDLKVATTHTTGSQVYPGLTLQGSLTTVGQVDATIGNDTNSTTTIAGDLKIASNVIKNSSDTSVITFSGNSITVADLVTTTINVGTSITFDSIDIDNLLIGGDTFQDVDTSLMTAAAIKDLVDAGTTSITDDIIPIGTGSGIEASTLQFTTGASGYKHLSNESMDHFHFHTQDMAADGSGFTTSRNYTIRTGMAPNFDSQTGTTTLSDSTGRASGQLTISSGQVNNFGSGDCTSGNVLINTGAVYSSSGTSTQGVVMIGNNTNEVEIGKTSGGTIKLKADVTQIGLDSPSTNEVLTWDGSKAVWSAAAGGATVNNELANRLVTSNGSNGDLDAEPDLTFDALKLSIGDNSQNRAFLSRQRAATGNNGGIMVVQGGDSKGTDKDGGDIELSAGKGTGDGESGKISFLTHVPDLGNSGTTTLGTVTEVAKITPLGDIEIVANKGKFRGSNMGTVYKSAIYLTPADFMHADTNKVAEIEDNGGSITAGNDTANYVAIVQVPDGFKATHVRLYGDANTSQERVYYYSSTVSSSSDTNLMPNNSFGYVNAETTLDTHFTGAAGRYMMIKWDPANTTNKLYGAKVTITTT